MAKSRVPGAAQSEALRCRTGDPDNRMGPGLALAPTDPLRRIRDTRSEQASMSTNAAHPRPHRFPPHRDQGRLVAAGRFGRRPAARGLAARAVRGHRLAARGQARHPGGVVRRDRARPLGAEAAAGRAGAGRLAGRRRGRADRARPHLGGDAGRARHHRRADSRHARRYRGAPPLSQRPLHHRPAAGMEERAGDQRERHRRHQRDPLRRQRPPRRARRHHDERGPAGAALGHRRAV